tara:strand:+ start:1192 stop:1587 length:396 start_codon:yes stop_codon:yes gene_type:complete
MDLTGLEKQYDEWVAAGKPPTSPAARAEEDQDIVQPFESRWPSAVAELDCRVLLDSPVQQYVQPPSSPYGLAITKSSWPAPASPASVVGIQLDPNEPEQAMLSSPSTKFKQWEPRAQPQSPSFLLPPSLTA